MSRVQLALNVRDVDAAVAFYSKLFGAEPAKRRPGYANFAIAEPPLKLVLIENDGAPGSMNHLGVEVDDAAAVQSAITAFAAQELSTDVEAGVTCCYAVQDKVWVSDPDGARWEVYTVLADADTMAPAASDGTPGSCSCETPQAAAPGASASACC
jgi:catechol 2,3-dioxygenase-like lactoylglutathione lyase family enzyme